MHRQAIRVSNLQAILRTCALRSQQSENGIMLQKKLAEPKGTPHEGGDEKASHFARSRDVWILGSPRYAGASQS
jgi:hypothetical protein